jgi:hypothetical protein
VAAAQIPPSGVTLITCFTMSGEVTASGGFYDSDEGAGATSCAAWAENGQQIPGGAGEALPAPDPSTAGVSVNGEELAFNFYIGPYTGPAAYPSTALDELATYGETTWGNTSTSQFTAQVKADGSGTLTTTLGDDSGNGQNETITETWTCATFPS